jgi:hypothetical protein
MRSYFSTAMLSVAAISVFGASAVTPGAHATTLMRMGLDRLAHAAKEIVRARCVANTTAWDHGEIWTFTTFDVEETWRGAANGRITVKLLGGRTQQVTSLVSGVPRFRPGEDVVLFLEPAEDGTFSVTSWQQGVFRVSRDAASGTETVTQDTAYFETFDPATRRFAASGIRRMNVAAFRSEVGAALEGAPEEQP